MTYCEDIALSQKFLLEANKQQKEAHISGEPAADVAARYVHVMAEAIERRSTAGPAYKSMILDIQELTTPRAATYIRTTQPHALETLLAIKASAGKLEEALHPAPACTMHG